MELDRTMEAHVAQRGRRRVAAALCLGIGLLGACEGSDPESAPDRPEVEGALGVESAPAAESLEVSGVARPGYRWPASPGSEQTLELSPFGPGVLVTTVAVEGTGGAQVSIRLRDASSSSGDSVECVRSFSSTAEPEWVACELIVQRPFVRPVFEIDWDAPAGSWILLSSPTHVPR